VTALTHPHGGAWLACCLETLIASVAPSALANAIRERYRLPRLDPLEVNADIPPEDPEPPTRIRRYRVQTIANARRCYTCGELRLCRYVPPGFRRKLTTGEHQCETCYKARLTR
jgi:hypothetical protein